MNTHAPEAINGGIGLIFGGFSTASVLIFWGLAAIMWHRTRSPHMLMSKLWTLFNGKNKCANIVINHILEERSSIMKFRFHTRIQIRDAQQASAVWQWSNANHEDIDNIASCGNYFDLETPGLKPLQQLPGSWMGFTLGIAVVAMIMAILLATFGTVTDRALLQVKASGVLFTLDSVYAKRLNNKPGFTLKNCTADHHDLAASSGFSLADVNLICTSFDANEIPDLVRTSVYSQRYISGFFLVGLLYFFRPCFSQFRNVVSAQKMYRRLQNRAR